MLTKRMHSSQLCPLLRGLWSGQPMTSTKFKIISLCRRNFLNCNSNLKLRKELNNLEVYGNRNLLFYDKSVPRFETESFDAASLRKTNLQNFHPAINTNLNVMDKMKKKRRKPRSQSLPKIPGDVKFSCQDRLKVNLLATNVGKLNGVSRLFSTTASDVSKCDASGDGVQPVPAQNIDSLDEMHKAPKNILHNAFDVVAQQLNNREFKLQPTYTIVKGKNANNSWCCTYNAKWPEPMRFVGVGKTKQEASHKAAVSALVWLKKNGRITKDGHPLVIDKNEIKELTRKDIPLLTLSKDTVEQMNNITHIYQDEFVPLLAQNLDKTKKQHSKELGIENEMYRNVEPKVLRKSTYFTREKLELPISAHKENFINLLRENQAVIIKGEPGCGKSTRIPQYVLESWAREGLDSGAPCRIVVTQPRRIAAISLANRVADERDERSGHVIGFQVRLQSNYNPTTGRILYCTTGILLKHLQSDLSLSNFTHIILDEAHERDVNTDLLLNLLRNILKTNPNLKLIVMSATVDTDLFKSYLNDAPVMHIPGFTYPVKTHFIDDFRQIDLSRSVKNCNVESPTVVHEDVAKLVDYIHRTKSEGAILCFLPGWEDIVKVEKLIQGSSDLSVLCLHSRLQDSDQRKIFFRAPPGVRKVILSTNIAETSVTIDDVVYVVDTGIHKENRFDNDKGVMCIDNYWISQASMTQRRGRAGRVQPGESFHLYTKSKYDSFAKFTDPEILKTSLTKIVLNAKVCSNNMDALEFMSHLPSPPEKTVTRRAVRELRDLQLLDEDENLTALGRTLANFQLEPKLAKVLVNAVVYKCVTPVVDVVTIFSSNSELFRSGLVDKSGIKRIKEQGSRHSDHLAMMRLFEGWLELMEEHDTWTAERYCVDANLVHHRLVTLNKLRKIHFDYLYELHPALPVSDDYSDNDELVKAILFSGVGTLLVHRNWDVVKGRYKKGCFFINNYNQKATITSDSVNFKKTSFPSNLLVYFNEVRSNIRRTTMIRECSVISPLAVLLFSDKELITRDIEDDKVVMALRNTSIEFICTKEIANSMQKCKEALNSGYWYFIFQMTEGGERNSYVNEIWDKILKHVHSIISKNSIK